MNKINDTIKNDGPTVAQWIDFTQQEDARGKLAAIEGKVHIPFNIKRVYYLYDTAPNVRRGFHAHKELQQVLICVSGECKIFLDDGFQKEDIVLATPHRGLFIDKMIWHEMYNFSKDCVLLVLASEVYCEDDYIREYNVFFDRVKSK